jgi:molybdopterin synthase catalytic subunit
MTLSQPNRPVNRSVVLTADPLDEACLAISRPLSASAGAVVSFLGCVRAMESGRVLAAIEYEAFPEMVHRQFQMILEQAEARWPLESVEVVHRTGRVEPGQPSVWIRVISPHRAEALEALGWMLDEMKRIVPIWKRPVWE